MSCRLPVWTTALLMLSSCPIYGTTLRIRTVDESGANFPNVLVIVRPLDFGSELFRALSNEQGNILPRDVDPGLYQIIAVCPYGICKATVEEILVESKPSQELVFKVKLKPIIDTVVIGVPQLNVQVEDNNGNPIVGLRILARNSEASFQRWYTTDPTGKIWGEFEGDPTVLVFYYKGKIVTREVREPHSQAAELALLQCEKSIPMKPQSVDLVVKLP